MDNYFTIKRASDIVRNFFAAAISEMHESTPIEEWWPHLINDIFLSSKQPVPKRMDVSLLDSQSVLKYIVFSEYGKKNFYEFYGNQIGKLERAVYEKRLMAAMKIRNQVLAHDNQESSEKYEANDAKLLEDLNLYMSLLEPFNNRKSLRHFYIELIALKDDAFQTIRSVKMEVKSVAEELLEYNICINEKQLKLACVEIGIGLTEGSNYIQARSKAEMLNELAKFFSKNQNAAATQNKESKQNFSLIEDDDLLIESLNGQEKADHDDAAKRLLEKYDKLNESDLERIVEKYNLTLDSSVMLDNTAWGFIEKTIVPLGIKFNKQIYLDHTLVKNVLELARVHYTEEEARLIPQSVLVKNQAKRAHKSMIKLKEHGLIEILSSNINSNNSQEKLYQILKKVTQPFAIIIQDEEFARRCLNMGKANLMIIKAVSDKDAVIIR